ncbi:MAG: hypothetical protein CVV53_07295 [Spirochaetae bacterium HGW-Spirochaetae-9]|nr:MAG: hypothetical protein CVV53_07295 [Spirochaetae bacterium HGW-Spirochaetae-9]
MFGIDIRWRKDNNFYMAQVIRTKQLGGKELPVEGVILESDDEGVGMKFLKAVGKLYGIPVSNNRVLLKARSMGNGAGK